ncbi:hypothetical protein BY458DRAFT_533404 [Sporodiniella umbellata]|nr:hypothetical protein BY458DRAFT_533404 [Sporodiniella umbellata]
MSEGISSLPLSYYENFLESLAQIVSKLLTDRETETVLSSIRTFQEKLRQLSSRNLQRLNLEITASEKGQSSRCKHTDKTCAQNCTRGFVRTFAVAYSIKYVIGILPSLLTGKIFKKPAILKQMAGSSFISSYKGILCAMRHFRKSTDNGSDRLNAFFAGCVAGSALVFDRDKRRRQSVMLYLFTRALQFNCTWLMKKWSNKRELDHSGKVKWDDHLARFAQKYSGVAVMMIASAQIVFAYLFHHDTLPRSYFSFLLTHGGFKRNFGKMAAPAAEAVGLTVNQLVEDGSSIMIPDGMSTREFYMQNLSPNIGSSIGPKMHHKYILCGIQHPLTDSCSQDKVNLFAEEFLRSAKLYVPLNIIKAIYDKSKARGEKLFCLVFAIMFLPDYVCRNRPMYSLLVTAYVE